LHVAAFRPIARDVTPHHPSAAAPGALSVSPSTVRLGNSIASHPREPRRALQDERYILFPAIFPNYRWRAGSNCATVTAEL